MGPSKKIEQVLARYFWGSCNNKNKTHWIKWKQIFLPTNEGGLGLRRLKDMVDAFSLKLWWRFREKGSLWAQYMHQKYCSFSSPLVVSLLNPYSPTWRRMYKAGIRCQEYIRWSIGNGTISFWDDIWLGYQPLNSLYHPEASPQFKRVEDFWNRGQWDVESLQNRHDSFGIQRENIEEILEVPIDGDERDVVRWTLTPHGNFTVSSAWELIRYREERSEVHEIIWSNCISPTISVFLWRLLANRLPVDAKLQWRCISLESKCNCCCKPEIETRLHLFVFSEAAMNIWNHFARWFPNGPHFEAAEISIEARLSWWQRPTQSNTNNHISTIIPCLILWFIWTERNDCVHRDKGFKNDHVAKRIVLHLKNLVMVGKMGPAQWSGCSSKVECMAVLPARARVKMIEKIEWKPPDPPWIKLNTDGAYEASSCKVGGGGIARNN